MKNEILHSRGYTRAIRDQKKEEVIDHIWSSGKIEGLPFTKEDVRKVVILRQFNSRKNPRNPASTKRRDTEGVA